MRRICLSHSLHPWTWTTIATRRLPSCVSPLLDYYYLGSRAPLEVFSRRIGSTSFRRLASASSSWAVLRRFRNINRMSIDYACRPRLRSRLTLSRRTLLRKPRTIGGEDSHPSCATYAGILTSQRSTGSLPRPLHSNGNALLPLESHACDTSSQLRRLA